MPTQHGMFHHDVESAAMQKQIQLNACPRNSGIGSSIVQNPNHDEAVVAQRGHAAKCWDMTKLAQVGPNHLNLDNFDGRSLAQSSHFKFDAAFLRFTINGVTRLRSNVVLTE